MRLLVYERVSRKAGKSIQPTRALIYPDPHRTMSFIIPWRLLIPPGSVESVIGSDDGHALQQRTGAKVFVSTSEEAPVTLSDKIVKIEGAVTEKEAALAHIVGELFEFQGTPDDEDGLCVLVMPSCAIGAVIGTKGSKISEIMAESGCEIDVGRECIIGMPDNPMVLRGRPQQIVRGALLANTVLQDLAEKGRVQPDDFRYIPGRQSAPRPVRGTFSSAPAARLIVEKEFAGFLIGKGGEKIKRIRDQTGATLQFRSSAEEVTLTLAPEQRVLDIRGSSQERDLAVKACFVEMDAASMHSTRLLLPLAVPEIPLEEAVVAAGASVGQIQDESIASPESSERVVRLDGDSSARLAAVLALLAKADVHAPVSNSQAPKPVSPVRPAPVTEQIHPSRGDSPVRPARVTEQVQPSQGNGLERSASIQPRMEKKLEPESGKVFTFPEFQKAFATEYSEKDILDYWRDACKPVPETEKEAMPAPKSPEIDKRGQFHQERAQADDKSDQPKGPAQTALTAPPGLESLRTENQKKPHFGMSRALADSPPSELHVLLPAKSIRPLISNGHLAEIAVGCNVQLDVCSEVSPGQVEVILNGTCAAIAMATLALQMRIYFVSHV